MNAGDMPEPPVPIVATDSLSGLSFSQAINSPRFFAGKLFLATIHIGVLAREPDRLEIPDDIVLKRIGRSIHHMRFPVTDAERVAIGGRARDLADSQSSRLRRTRSQ
jgi:hypothetical protein